MMVGMMLSMQQQDPEGYSDHVIRSLLVVRYPLSSKNNFC
jgi:hypothetical protein